MKFALIPLSIVLVVAGFSRPEFAARGAELLVACTVVMVVWSLVADQWSESESQIATPFVPPEPATTSGAETPDVTELVRAVESSAGRLPPTIATHVANACRGRLADHHRLHVRSGSDQRAIRDLVSPTMWSLISAETDDVVDLPIRILPQLLDEVEAL